MKSAADLDWITPDGTRGPGRHDVRSVNGSDGAWFGAARRRREGHVDAGGVGKEVRFEDTDHAVDDAIDEEYRRKYGRSSTAVQHITSPKARSTAIRLVPA
jgi:hypothetical protein